MTSDAGACFDHGFAWTPFARCGPESADLAAAGLYSFFWGATPRCLFAGWFFLPCPKFAPGFFY
jgi:hypothetical protein